MPFSHLKAYNVAQHTILITTCTNRKRALVPPSLQASSLDQGPQDDVFREWRTRLAQNPSVDKASSIYCGRAFREAVKACEELSAPLWIISAGLGLLLEEQEIPAYSLTINPSGPDSILKKIQGDRFSPGRWWEEINLLRGSSRPISRLVEDNPNALLLIAFSQSYARLVQADLLSLSDQHLRRVRLIGLALKPLLDPRLQDLVMPYDERFDGPDGSNIGTRSDFAQRAMRHFATELLPDSGRNEPQLHARLVMEFLSARTYRAIPVRKRLSDQEIIDLIIHDWPICGGNCSNMLRAIRQHGVACEQSRFQKLYKSAKSEIQA